MSCKEQEKRRTMRQKKESEATQTQKEISIHVMRTEPIPENSCITYQIANYSNNAISIKEKQGLMNSEKNENESQYHILSLFPIISTCNRDKLSALMRQLLNTLMYVYFSFG